MFATAIMLGYFYVFLFGFIAGAAFAYWLSGKMG